MKCEEFRTVKARLVAKQRSTTTHLLHYFPIEFIVKEIKQSIISNNERSRQQEDGKCFDSHGSVLFLGFVELPFVCDWAAIVR